MAMRKVELTEEEKKEGMQSFKKFETLGDKASGFYLGKVTKTKTFKIEEGPKTITDYHFWSPTDGEFVVSPPFDLQRQLNKAERPESAGGYGLAPFDGKRPHLVVMKYANTQAIPNQTNPMKVFALGVDTEPSVPPEIIAKIPRKSFAGSPAPAPQAGPPQRNPPPLAEDDIPF